MRCNDSLGRGKHYCYKLNPLSIATRPLNSLKGTFAFERDVLKFSFGLAVGMKRRIEIETENPETIYASVSCFFFKEVFIL